MLGSRLRLSLLALALVSGFACGDHLLGIDDDDEPETIPVCMILSGTVGYWENGDSNLVWDLAHDPAVAARCLRIIDAVRSIAGKPET